MRWRSKALGINAGAKSGKSTRWQTEAVQRVGKANRVVASQVKALAKQGVTRHWQSKLSHGLDWQTRVFNIRAKDFNNEGNEGSYHFS